MTTSKRKKSRGPSATPDSALDLHQIHCRYAILGGLKMDTANILWDEMKGKYPDRESHMEALFEQLPNAKEYIAQPPEYSLLNQYIKEGEENRKEVKQLSRNRALVNCRLELDNYTCQYCGFSIRRDGLTNINSSDISGVVVEVHHKYPIKEGDRESRLSDLVTLCPTCHRIIHLLGRILDTNDLQIELLRKHYPVSGSLK